MLGAAAGNGSFAYISAAGEMLSALLTKEPPEGIDSVILLQQPHYWPRGAGWGDGISSDDGFAPTMVAPCAHERAAVRDRIHFTTEIVDFRARCGWLAVPVAVAYLECVEGCVCEFVP